MKIYADPACNRLQIGNNCIICPYVCLGQEGFGFERADEKDYDKPRKRRDHPFGVIIGNNVDIGSHCVVHRGRWRDTEIGDDTKIDSLVHVAHNAVIGKSCFLVAGTVVGGSCTIGDECFIGENVSIKQGLKIANNVTLGAGSVVTKDITKSNTTWIGVPARKLYNKQVF